MVLLDSPTTAHVWVSVSTRRISSSSMPRECPVGAREMRSCAAPTLWRMSSRVLTAVAWPYANGPRHIGHVSGFGVPSDVFSRYRRMAGDRVLMVSGTDEHGTPILVE